MLDVVDRHWTDDVVPVSTEREWNGWFASADKACRYHLGDLEGKAVRRLLPRLAYNAYRTGTVTLVQRKICENCTNGNNPKGFSHGR